MGSDATQFLVDPLNLRENVFGGGQQQPNLTTYGGGMKEALETQLALLTGKKVGDADFTSVGSLESLLPIEQSLREKAAQVDTDVLRSTLLGGQTGGQTQEVTYDDQGRAISGFSEPGEAKIRAVIEDSDGNVIPDAGDPNKFDEYKNRAQRVRVEFVDEGGNVIEQTAIRPITGNMELGSFQNALEPTLTELTDELITGLEANPNFDQDILASIKNDRESISGFDQKIIMGSEGFDGFGMGENQNSYAITDAQPIFAKDAEGNIITDVSKAGTTETTTLPTQRTGDGLIDLLGDSRNVTGQKQDFAQYVKDNPDLLQQFQESRRQGDTRTIEEYGQQHYQEFGRAEGRELPTTFGELGRRAGFDAEDNFLGAAAYAEDLAAGNLSRQRERDLLDVARLSGTYQDIMEDYKPGTQQALSDAREVLAGQKDTLTGAGAITVPTDSTFAGVGNVKVADPLRLQANTQFDQELARGGDSLRSDILSDARTALGQGLTERERNAISEAFKARSTLMGRTFDQSAGIAEAEARVAEDNARRMQNRAFAQSVLGQEAGLQQGDITRGMAQESEQAGLQQRRDLVQSDVDLRSALADQAQQQQANQFGVGATMDAERLNEQLRQQGTLGYLQAAGNLAALEDRTTLDPFRAVLGRGGGQSLSSGQSVLGTAGYGLGSGPQFINPESGLGFIQNQNTNLMNMYNAQTQADAERFSGLTSAAATAALAACWVAREVYGVNNPAWVAFRYWMLNESPSWFRATYLKYGERFARFIADKPRLKARIRTWMDSKIGR
jgi:hypothetical protein